MVAVVEEVLLAKENVVAKLSIKPKMKELAVVPSYSLAKVAG